MTIMAVLLLCFGLLLGWMALGASPAAAADTSDIMLNGHALETETSVKGGYTDSNDVGFIFYYQVYGDASNY